MAIGRQGLLMRAGTMRDQITWQSFTVSQDAVGEPIKTWANLASTPTMFADVQSQPAGERFLSGGEQLQSKLIHKVTIRYRADLTVQMRGLWGSRILQIENIVDPDGRKAILVVTCKEIEF